MHPRSQDPQGRRPQAQDPFGRARPLESADLPWGSEEDTRQAYLRFLKRLWLTRRAEAHSAGIRFDPLEEAERRGEVIRPRPPALGKPRAGAAHPPAKRRERP